MSTASDSYDSLHSLDSGGDLKMATSDNLHCQKRKQNRVIYYRQDHHEIHTVYICSHIRPCAHLLLVVNQAIALKLSYFTVRHTCKCHENELTGEDTTNPAWL